MRIALLLPVLLTACGSASGEPGSPEELRALEIRNLAIHDEVLTAGQPDEAQLRALPAHGVDVIVCLRGEGERGSGWEEEVTGPMDVRFVRVPVAGADGLTEENVRRLATALEGARRPFVYCGSSNRVGALFALKAYMVDGLSKEDALARGRAYGLTRLEPVVRSRLNMK